MKHSKYLSVCAALLLAACGSNEEPAAPEAAATETVAADAAAPPTADGDVDVKVPGTDYEATATIKCGTSGSLDSECSAGVKRNWGDEPGGALVEVTKPDGTMRGIFFRGTEAYGADSAQADGSAAYDFKVTRNGDVSTIEYGPERYEIVDALVEGG